MTSILKALTSAEASGDYLIETIEILYRRSKDEHPGCDPHVALANTWLQKERSLFKADDIESAYLVTAPCACLQEPSNARMLAYHFMEARMPELLEKFSRFAAEVEELGRPVRTIRREPGAVEALYLSLNPKQAPDGRGLTGLRAFLAYLEADEFSCQESSRAYTPHPRL